MAALRSPLTMIGVASSVKQYPQECFARCWTIRPIT